jgi:hypothetical protein
MGKPIKHGPDHSPGGYDPIPGVGDPMWPTAYNLSPMLYDMYTNVLPSGGSPSSFVIDSECVHNGYFQMSGNSRAFYFRVRLGPKGSLWYTNPLFVSMADSAVITVDFATDTDDSLNPTLYGAAGPIGLMGDQPANLTYPRDLTTNGGFNFNLNTYDTYLNGSTFKNSVGSLGNMFRIGGDPGDPHTKWTWDNYNGWPVSDGGPGLWAVRVKIEDRTDSHLHQASIPDTANVLRLINLPLVRLSGFQVM